MLHNSASRKIARSTLLSLCCWALSASAFAQITNVSTATTSTQAILSYTAPDPLVRCSLEVRENNASKVVNDVNSMIFPNADIDLTRAGTLATGRRRVVVVGKRAAESGIDGFNHSRALQNNTQHTFKVTCGSQSTATGSFTTQNLPLGMTYNDPLPADPNHPGDYAWPDLNWTNHDWAIDPFTGVQIKMADSPRNATDLIQSNFASATPLSGSAWMGASNAIADDTAAATYSGTTKDWLRLEINVKLFFGAYHQGFNVSLNTFVPTFNAWCSSADCATASLDDRTIEYCISVDGVSCATPAPYLSTALVYCASNCTSTAYRFDSIVNPTPILADWYPNQKPTIDPTSFQSRSGSVKRVGTVVTLITGDPFSFDWHAGSTITIANVTYRIASVDNDQQLTLAGNYTDSEQNSPYTASNAYIFVRKKTATTHTISLQYASYKLETGGPPAWDDSGDQFGNANCSLTSVNGPNNEAGWHCTLGGTLYWIGQVSGTVNRLGRTFLPSYTNEWGYGYLAVAYWDNENPNAFYSVIQTPLNLTREPMLIRATYLGDNSDIGDLGSVQGLDSTHWQIDNLTPPSQGLGLTTQMANFHPEWNRSGFRSTFVQLLGVTSTSNKLGVVFYRDAANNDIETFYGVFDPTTKKVVAAIPSWAYWPMRWGSTHGATSLNDPRWILLPNSTNRGNLTGTDAAGRGPYLSTITSGAVSKTTAQPCPAQPITSKIPSADWPTGNKCITVTVDGEPADPTPGTYTQGMITTSGTTVTGIGTDWNQYLDKTQILINGVLYKFRYGSTTLGTLDSAPPPVSTPTTYTIFTEIVTPQLQGYLQDAQERDIFCGLNKADSACPQGYFAGEFFRLLIKNGNSWTLQRGYGGGGNTPPPYYALDANAKLLAWPTSCSYFADGVYACGKSAGYWDFQHDPYGYNVTSKTIVTDDLDQGCCHNTRNRGISVDAVATFCPVRDGTNYSCYNTRIGFLPDVLTSQNMSVIGNPYFNDKIGWGEPNSVDSHPSHTQAAAPLKDLAWFTDGRPFLGDAGMTGTQANPGQSLGGSLYKFTASQGTRFRPRSMPTMASCGASPLADVSGPSSSMSTGPSSNYTYCTALKSGECYNGSSVGDIYVNCPRIRKPYCTYPGIGQNPGEVQDICIGDMGGYTMNVIQVDGSRPDPTGANGRRITEAFGRYHYLQEFWNVKTTPDGKFLFTPSVSLQLQRTALLMVKMPPFPHDQPRDIPNRGAYIPISIAVTPINTTVATATVEFGYTPSFYCTSRKEICVKGAEANPEFRYASESPSGVNCARGCTIPVPAISQRILYYRVVQRDSTGKIVVATNPEAQAIP